MKKRLERLDIKWLSDRGEILNHVTCFPGQVTVFRGSTDKDVKPYRRALVGEPGPERMVVDLDAVTFHADDHCLIGFPHRTGSSAIASDRRVDENLLNAGLPEALVESVLIDFGLEEVKHSRVSTLTRCEERRLRLIESAYGMHSLIVMNDPFAPVADAWREPLARLIVDNAASQNQIVVVTNLTYRPQAWIDNDGIARIQVGHALQKTIGFAQLASAPQAFIEQVRDLLNRDPRLVTPQSEEPSLTEVDDEEAPVLPPHIAIAAKVAESPRAIVLGMAVLICGVSGWIATQPDAPVAAILPTKQMASVTVKSPSTAVNLRPAQAAQVSQRVEDLLGGGNPAQPGQAAVSPSQPQDAVGARFALDLFGPEVKASIVATYDGSISPDQTEAGELATVARLIERQQRRGGAIVVSEKGSLDAADLMRALAGASNPDTSGQRGEETGVIDAGAVPSQPYYMAPPLPPSEPQFVPPPPVENPFVNPMNEQQKREMIRQKFLEAIDRAARNQG